METTSVPPRYTYFKEVVKFTFICVLLYKSFTFNPDGLKTDGVIIIGGTQSDNWNTFQSKEVYILPLFYVGKKK